MTAHYNCDDFGSANPAHETGNLTAAAYAAADALRLTDRDARRFSQGFIHARQGRTPLVGFSHAYDLGFASGSAQ